MTREEALKIFRDNKALLEGHFILSSGLHSDKYMQSALVLQHADLTEKLAKALAGLFKDKKPGLVVGPALGAVVIGYETARALGVRGIFTERKDGKMQLRRGFQIKPGEKLIIIEDVITTGGSTKEVAEVMQKLGGEIVGVGAIVDRSGKDLAIAGRPVKSLIKMDIASYKPDACPMCKQGTPAVKPGSRSK